MLDVRTQVFVADLLNRLVRLDILATDNTGAKLNVEVQRSHKGSGRKRARYNSSMMDANFLKKGEDFDKLPEKWAIFITENDVMLLVNEQINPIPTSIKSEAMILPAPVVGDKSPYPTVVAVTNDQKRESFGFGQCSC